jgi:hypothetical protein
MAIYDDKWFEVWYLQGVDVTPSCLLIVTPDPESRSRMLVLDPYQKGKVVYAGKNYEDAMFWLREDDFTMVVGREFPDDGW